MLPKINLSELEKINGIGKKTLQEVRKYLINKGDIEKKSIEEVGFPNESYHVIYADPPWQYNDKKKAGRTKCGAENHYPTMSLEEIKKLPVQEISEENSVLFLWVTFPMIEEGLEVIKSWGFEYKTLGFDWTKLNKDKSVWHGVGAYAKSNNEICLMGVRGKVGRLLKDKEGNVVKTNPKEKLRVKSNYVSSNVQAVRQRHSKKPEEVRKRIEELFGEVSRIELFAREKAEGWTVWGNEV